MTNKDARRPRKTRAAMLAHITGVSTPTTRILVRPAGRGFRAAISMSGSFDSLVLGPGVAVAATSVPISPDRRKLRRSNVSPLNDCGC